MKASLKKHNILEVESTLPDMTSNARGNYYTTKKFLTEDESKIPESILIQTVNGEWGDNYEDIVDPTDKDMILVPDANSIPLIPWVDEPTTLVINDCHTNSGERHPLASRSVLRHILTL